jgi:hypothetical protein
MIDRPIFVGGMFRSGTSLLRAMIGQHPNIASGLETYWFAIDWDRRDDEDVQEKLQRLANFYEFDTKDVLSMADDSAAIHIFLSKLLSAYTLRLGKKRWAEKTPGNIQHMDRIVSGWPDAKIVHIIRDPKDIYASLREEKKWDSVEEFTERWCSIVGAVDGFRNKLDLGPDRYFELRYESLIADPIASTRALFEFLGESWSEDLAHFEGKADDFEKVRSATGKTSSPLKRLSQPLTATRVGIWRRVLSADEIDILRNAVSERGFGSAFRRIEEATPGT